MIVMYINWNMKELCRIKDQTKSKTFQSFNIVNHKYLCTGWILGDQAMRQRKAVVGARVGRILEQSDGSLSLDRALCGSFFTGGL